LDLLEIKCHRCERHGRVSLARLIEEHRADTGLPDLWESLAGDCQHARSTALNNRCAIYYPQLPMLFLLRSRRRQSHHSTSEQCLCRLRPCRPERSASSAPHHLRNPTLALGSSDALPAPGSSAAHI